MIILHFASVTFLRKSVFAMSDCVSICSKQDTQSRPRKYHQEQVSQPVTSNAKRMRREREPIEALTAVEVSLTPKSQCNTLEYDMI